MVTMIWVMPMRIFIYNKIRSLDMTFTAVIRIIGIKIMRVRIDISRLINYFPIYKLFPGNRHIYLIVWVIAPTESALYAYT